LDYEADIGWVKNLVNEEGIFGIVWDQRKGYRAGRFAMPSNMHLRPFAINMFALATGDPQYRPVHLIREELSCQNDMKLSETNSSSNKE
jgi:hypothetical protein